MQCCVTCNQPDLSLDIHSREIPKSSLAPSWKYTPDCLHGVRHMSDSYKFSFSFFNQQ